MIKLILRQFNIKTFLCQFVHLIQIYIIFALLNLIDFSKSEWWTYAQNPEIYRTLIVLFSIVFVDGCFFALNYYVLKIQGINILNVGLTGAFTFLVVHPTLNPIWLPAFSAFVAIVGRFFIRYKNRPVFNPAALGMFLTFLITWVLQKIGLLKSTLFISWWAADFGKRLEIGNFSISIYWIIFLPFFLYYVHKFRKVFYGAVFFFTLIICQSLYFLIFKDMSFSNLLLILSGGIGTWLFLSFLMVIEPKTAPVFKRDQIILGVFGGILLTLLYRIESLPAHEIITILVLNVSTLILGKVKITKNINNSNTQ